MTTEETDLQNDFSNQSTMLEYTDNGTFCIFSSRRRHTRWMFVALALVFGVGFVAFGVGAGGTGIGDIFRNHQSGGGAPSVKSALAATQKRPDDPKARQELANAYRTKNDPDHPNAAQIP